MRLEDIKPGERYIKTAAYNGRAWFEVECISVDVRAEEAVFKTTKCLSDDSGMFGSGIDMQDSLNKIECERYIKEK